MDTIKQVVQGIKFEPFEIETTAIGCFTPTRILWMGTSNEERLNALAQELRNNLDTHGIGYTSLAFKSHITLVKKPSRFITDIAVPSAKMLVERISIMESVGGNGQLVNEEK